MTRVRLGIQVYPREWRGNRYLDAGRRYEAGSIPASAGEPGEVKRGDQEERVYPRECGGTSAMRICRPDSDGLSPRVRGNLISRRSHTAEYRSIPASAGEPARELFQKQGAAVYPRECGGTFHLGFHVPLGTGLSPASAGEPCLPQ